MQAFKVFIIIGGVPDHFTATTLCRAGNVQTSHAIAMPAPSIFHVVAMDRLFISWHHTKQCGDTHFAHTFLCQFSVQFARLPQRFNKLIFQQFVARVDSQSLHRVFSFGDQFTADKGQSGQIERQSFTSPSSGADNGSSRAVLALLQSAQYVFAGFLLKVGEVVHSARVAEQG